MSNLMAGFHVYNSNCCRQHDQAAGTRTITVAAQVPVLIGEMGEHTCAHGFIDQFMDVGRRQGPVGYLGWGGTPQTAHVPGADQRHRRNPHSVRPGAAAITWSRSTRSASAKAGSPAGARAARSNIRGPENEGGPRPCGRPRLGVATIEAVLLRRGRRPTSSRSCPRSSRPWGPCPSSPSCLSWRARRSPALSRRSWRRRPRGPPRRPALGGVFDLRAKAEPAVKASSESPSIALRIMVILRCALVDGGS